ncbi:hypothetical protein P389DRAFT_164781 [Cystobasidium minutum MCA 4210]|uniref:uncharacterized protein n=1 Tax=Cystobasidium minutum MCA 4210 TaxID=1397322 RepID=UPI0034CDDA46|eukprot:jgi/Rhomi1/164781/fgenesh1_kg.1_\
MVSFSCNACQDTLKKPKLVQHFQRCHAPFTCLDCNKEMWDGEFQKHTTCISEAEKYEKSVYKGDKKKNKQQQQQQQKNEKKPQVQQQQSKPVEAPSAAATTPALAAPSVPSTSVPAVNGTTKPTPIDSQVIAAEVKAAPTDSAPATSKKERKRKRRSEAAKTTDADAGNTSEAQVANDLLAEKPVPKAAPAAAPAQKKEETKEAEKKEDEVKTESQRSKKRARKSKNKEAASTNGDASTMEVDVKPAANGASTESTSPSEPAPKVDLKETLESKVREKGKSVSLAECLAGLSAEKIQEVLGGLRVQRGKKERFELTVGYA